MSHFIDLSGVQPPWHHYLHIILHLRLIYLLLNPIGYLFILLFLLQVEGGLLLLVQVVSRGRKRAARSEAT